MTESNAYRRWYRAHRTQRTVPELLSEEQRSAVMAGFGITPREADVLWQLFSDSGNESIARALNLSENTVRTHRERLFAKLGVTGSTEAVAVVSAAVIAGLVESDADPASPPLASENSY